MKVAVLSGKGGTGKTFVSTNLAAVMKNAVYVDCDVEEPNGRLFLPCADPARKDVCVLLPRFQKEKCTGCRKCVQFCMFNALAFIGNAPKVFREVCHSCGGCKLLCAEGAIEEEPVAVGTVETGRYQDIYVVTGEMNVGEASGVPVIRKALEEAFSVDAPLTVIDCPPGSACTVTESISAADYCLMVAEPTLFGVHNLRMVMELAKTVKKPCGIVINKYDGDFPELDRLCAEENIPVLAKIPYKKEYAACISAGRLAAEEFEEAKTLFRTLAAQIGGAL